MTNRLALSLTLLFFALFLSACSAPSTGTLQPALPKDDIVTRLLNAANQSSGERSVELRIEAARVLYSRNQANDANQILDQLDTRTLPTYLSLNIASIRAEHALSNNNPRQALDYWSYARFPAELAPDDILEISQSRSSIYLQTSDPIGAIRELVTGTQMTDDQKTQNALRELIERALDQTSLADLHAAVKSPQNNYFEQGWFELGLIQRSELSAEEKEDALEDWEALWAQHPATLSSPTSQQSPFFSGTALESIAPGSRRIGLLLPYSGPLAEIARYITDGFTTAMLTDGALNTHIETLDSTQITNPEQLFEIATQRGLEIIIGPLEREYVNRLAELPNHPVPVLALNQANTGSNPPFQLDLSSEHEASELARRAAELGYQTALIITSDTPWAQRLGQSIEQEFFKQGGQTLATLEFKGQGDTSAQIRGLLNNDRLLAQTMPRRSQSGQRVNVSHETDVIFMAVDARDARLINPMLAYHYVAKIPVMATSHLFEGSIDNVRDTDLARISFTDIPWRLSDSSELRNTLAASRDNTHTNEGKFYALGADAWRLHSVLNELSMRPGSYIDGETGRLSVGPNKRIIRRLSWATFTNGIPQLIKE